MSPSITTRYPARALRAIGLLLADYVPTVGRGKTFLRVNQLFFTKTAIPQERKVEKLESYGKNWNFWPKTEILGPKKTPTSGWTRYSGPDRKKLFKEKRTLFQNKYQSLGKFLVCVFFWVKRIFGQATTFRPNVKTVVSP